ncbi:NCK-interacting protein with SH3 domain-like isoform X2 [Artemia franciscana]|uniref:SH3 domain-containing protein n=1 Tax=Artemia franciscana TaxID=6661 RepID=A0AA88IBG4_ARTSF|nr:hypothetical protein QYM36_000571 [Artemia franciscana]
MTVSPSSPELVIFEAEYDYGAKYEHTLEIKKGMKLLRLQGMNKDEHWINALNDKGNWGYVPLNYLKQLQMPDDDCFHFLGNLLNTFVKQNIQSEEGDKIRAYLSILYSVQLQKTKKLVQDNEYHLCQDEWNRENTDTGNDLRTIQLKECSTASFGEIEELNAIESLANGCLQETVTEKSKKETAANNFSNVERLPLQDQCDTRQTNKVLIAFEAVDYVRQSTDLSFPDSVTAVLSVLRVINSRLKEGALSQIDLSDLENYLEVDFHTPKSPECTLDGQQLIDLFNYIEELTNDLFDDPLRLEDWTVIARKLERTLVLLVKSDPYIVRQILSQRKFEDLNRLVALYQTKATSEVHCLVRRLLDRLFQIEERICDILVLSALPIELLTEVQAIKFLATSSCISGIFDVIENLYKILNEPEPPSNAELAIDHLISLVMQLHLKACDKNLVIGPLSNLDSAKGLTQKLILNFNQSALNSANEGNEEEKALKSMLLDVFNDEKAASLFYETDLQVMIDIVLRNVTNSDPGSKDRTFNLKLIDRLLHSTSWKTMGYKFSELRSLLKNIEHEEAVLGEMPTSTIEDHEIVKSITLLLS